MPLLSLFFRRKNNDGCASLQQLLRKKKRKIRRIKRYYTMWLIRVDPISFFPYMMFIKESHIFWMREWNVCIFLFRSTKQRSVLSATALIKSQRPQRNHRIGDSQSLCAWFSFDKGEKKRGEWKGFPSDRRRSLRSDLFHLAVRENPPHFFPSISFIVRANSEDVACAQTIRDLRHVPLEL